MNSIITMEDTIAAIATAINIGEGGIAVIRVSGADSIEICKTIIETKSKLAWKSHRVFHGFAKDISEDKYLDEILVLVMKSPNSFTGEDIVEIHCHGGIIVVNRILELLIKTGKIRLANHGEFSQRAFLNGKIDLTQAESINQLISSKNVRSAELAFNGVKGLIKEKIDLIKNNLIEQLAEIEARVDFEEDFKDFDYIKFEKDLNKIKNEINSLVETQKRNSYIHNGISIALIGKTNAGKSSLLNLLSKQNKAIVTNIPGTTRDIIEVDLTIHNIPIKIIDTAGIRETKGIIENIGISKSLEMIKKADYIIYIFDIEKGLDLEDEKIIKKIPNQKLITLIGNKLDIVEKGFSETNNQSHNTIYMSIKNKIGEQKLINQIIKKCSSERSENIEIFLNDRQLSNLISSLKNLNDTKQIIKNKLPFDLLSIELRDSIKNLSKLTGEELNEQLLDNIFSKFCIGK